MKNLTKYSALVALTTGLVAGSISATANTNYVKDGELHNAASHSLESTHSTSSTPSKVGKTDYVKDGELTHDSSKERASSDADILGTAPTNYVKDGEINENMDELGQIKSEEIENTNYVKDGKYKDVTEGENLSRANDSADKSAQDLTPAPTNYVKDGELTENSGENIGEVTTSQLDTTNYVKDGELNNSAQ